VTHQKIQDKDAASDTGETGTATSPEPSPPEQTPFERFEEFARKVVSVPKTEIDRREKAYRETRKS
jgi:hypothetical protein